MVVKVPEQYAPVLESRPVLDPRIRRSPTPSPTVRMLGRWRLPRTVLRAAAAPLRAAVVPPCAAQIQPGATAMGKNKKQGGQPAPPPQPPKPKREKQQPPAPVKLAPGQEDGKGVLHYSSFLQVRTAGPAPGRGVGGGGAGLAGAYCRPVTSLTGWMDGCGLRAAGACYGRCPQQPVRVAVL